SFPCQGKVVAPIPPIIPSVIHLAARCASRGNMRPDACLMRAPSMVWRNASGGDCFRSRTGPEQGDDGGEVSERRDESIHLRTILFRQKEAKSILPATGEDALRFFSR